MCFVQICTTRQVRPISCLVTLHGPDGNLSFKCSKHPQSPMGRCYVHCFSFPERILRLVEVPLDHIARYNHGLYISLCRGALSVVQRTLPHLGQPFKAGEFFKEKSAINLEGSNMS